MATQTLPEILLSHLLAVPSAYSCFIFSLTHIREAAGMIIKQSRKGQAEEASGFKDCCSGWHFHKSRAWAGRGHTQGTGVRETEGMLKAISVREAVIITTIVWPDRLSGTFWGTCGTPFEIDFQRIHGVRLSNWTPHLLSLALGWIPPNWV